MNAKKRTKLNDGEPSRTLFQTFRLSFRLTDIESRVNSTCRRLVNFDMRQRLQLENEIQANLAHVKDVRTSRAMTKLCSVVAKADAYTKRKENCSKNNRNVFHHAFRMSFRISPGCAVGTGTPRVQ